MYWYKQLRIQKDKKNLLPPFNCHKQKHNLYVDLQKLHYWDCELLNHHKAVPQLYVKFPSRSDLVYPANYHLRVLSIVPHWYVVPWGIQSISRHDDTGIASWWRPAYGVYLDMMTLAKPLAGGLPIGDVLLTEADSIIGYGDHGSTFACSPGVSKPALVVLEKITKHGFLSSVARKGKYLKELLTQKIGGNARMREIRGVGLIAGI